MYRIYIQKGCADFRSVVYEPIKQQTRALDREGLSRLVFCSSPPPSRSGHVHDCVKSRRGSAARSPPRIKYPPPRLSFSHAVRRPALFHAPCPVLLSSSVRKREKCFNILLRYKCDVNTIKVPLYRESILSPRQRLLWHISPRVSRTGELNKLGKSLLYYQYYHAQLSLFLSFSRVSAMIIEFLYANFFARQFKQYISLMILYIHIHILYIIYM